MLFFLASSGSSLNEAPPGGVPSFLPAISLNVLIGLAALVSSANENAPLICEIDSISASSTVCSRDRA